MKLMPEILTTKNTVFSDIYFETEFLFVPTLTKRICAWIDVDPTRITMIVATVRYTVILYTDITSLTCWTRNAMFFFWIRSILTTHESFVIFYLILKQNMKVLKGTINLIETSPIDQYGIPNIAKFLVDLLGMNLFHKPKHNLHLFLNHLQ